MNLNKSKLVTLSAIMLMLLLISLAQSQSRSEKDNPRVADWSGEYFSSFYLIEDAPLGFEELDAISVDYLPSHESDERLLRPDLQGNISISGKLLTKNQKNYKFKEAKLIEGGRSIRLSLVTEH